MPYYKVITHYTETQTIKAKDEEEAASEAGASGLSSMHRIGELNFEGADVKVIEKPEDWEGEE